MALIRPYITEKFTSYKVEERTTLLSIAIWLKDDYSKKEPIGQTGVKMKEGNVTIFTQSSTSAISIMEYERGLVEDLPRILDMAVPEGINYSHNEMNSDDNGSGHIRSVLIGPSLTVPFSMGELLLGTWQSIIYVDFNTVSSKRSIILQFTGQ